MSSISTNVNRAVSDPINEKTHIWPLILTAFLVLSLISAAILFMQPRGEEFVRNHRALESISARYQGAADRYAAGIGAQTKRALEAVSSRYQGMADLYAEGNRPAAYHVLEIISVRYQAQADMHKTKGE